MAQSDCAHPFPSRSIPGTDRHAHRPGDARSLPAPRVQSGPALSARRHAQYTHTWLTLPLLLLLALCVPPPVNANHLTLTVNSTADEVDASPGDGVCASASGACTLRAAIQEANANQAFGTIMVPAGTYVLTIAGAGEDAAATGDLDITRSFNIIGAAAGSTIIDGGGLDRVFDIGLCPPVTPVTISGVTIRNGNAGAAPGGGVRACQVILNDSVITGNVANGGGGLAAGGAAFAGGVTLTDVTITNNTAGAGDGGGLSSAGSATLTRVVVRGNTAYRGGGLIFFGGFIVASTISENMANFGGGIYSPSSVSISNSTISGNTAAINGGGIIQQQFTLELMNVTITGNTAPVVGGVDYGGGGSAVRNTIIANNVGDNCRIQLFTQGHNLDSGNTCGFVEPGDLQNTDPLLGPLANNGGPTQTHALLGGSPAIDGGDSNFCSATDQRGVARPQGPGCDIGAYEMSVPVDLSVTKTVDPISILPVTYRITVTNIGATVAQGVTLSDPLPADTFFMGFVATSTQGTCGGFVTCQLGTLASGASATVTIVAGVARLGTIVNTASVTATGSDPNAANNTATATVTVVEPVTLTVFRGTGRVTSAPAGIDCGGPPPDLCSGRFAPGTAVTLTATPLIPGTVFLGWSGGGCTGTTTPCVLTLGADTTVSVTFSVLTYILTVSRVGSGSGTVTNNPGIACGLDCSEAYARDSTVSLIALPSPDSVFGGWAGCDAAAFTSCTVSLTGDRTVTATFTSRLPGLAIHLNTDRFHAGSMMTLDAVLVPGSPSCPGSAAPGCVEPAPTVVDAYVVVRLPNGSLLSLLLDGRLVPGIVPIATRLTPVPFSGQLISYTFTGSEPIGAYAWMAALTQAGTLNVLGSIQEVPFTFSP